MFCHYYFILLNKKLNKSFNSFASKLFPVKDFFFKFYLELAKYEPSLHGIYLDIEF